MTRALRNKVKPATHKYISAAALEEIAEDKGKALEFASSVPVIPERKLPIPSVAEALALVFEKHLV